jgi:hypothetical protein
MASGGRLNLTVRTFCPAKSGHFVLGWIAITHKSLISRIVRYGTWIAHSSSTSLKGRSDEQRCAVEVSCQPRIRVGKISPQLPGVAASIIKTLRVDSRTRVAIPARSRIAWDSRMGLFHCIAEDGIEDGKKRPVQQWAAGEK